MGLTDFFSKINMATGGKNPMEQIYAGLAGLGLQVSQQQGAVTLLEGTYKGRKTRLKIDSSNVMGAGNAGMMATAASMLQQATGINLSVFGRNRTLNTDTRRANFAKNMMQSAQMVFEWEMEGLSPASSSLDVGTTNNSGAAIGDGLFSNAQGAGLEAVNRPEVKAALKAGHFHEISAEGSSITAFWAPPMREYQVVVSSGDKFAPAVQATLDALTALSEALGS